MHFYVRIILKYPLLRYKIVLLQSYCGMYSCMSLNIFYKMNDQLIKAILENLNKYVLDSFFVHLKEKMYVVLSDGEIITFNPLISH